MSFERKNPHHVRHPEHGWLDADHPEVAGLSDRLIGGEPLPAESGKVYHREINCTTGLEGWTELTPEEIEEELHGAEREMERAAKAAAEELAQQQADRELIEKEAKRSPAFAALARRAGLID